MRTLYGWKFVLTIALPLLIASLGVGLLTFDLLSRVSTGANAEDRERTRQVVHSALGAIQLQLSNSANDNAYWDDAARELYTANVSQEWVSETWGVSSASGINYDAMYVIDRAMPKALSGYRKGEAFAPIITDYFSGQLDRLLDQLPQDNKSIESKAAIVETPDGLAVIAAAPIIPTSEDVKVPASLPRYLVFQKYLSPEYLAAIGKQYVIEGLAMTPASAHSSGAEPINGVGGLPVAYVQWSDRRPGDIAAAAVTHKAVLVLSFLAAVMVCIALLCWKLIGKIAAREERARHDALHDNLTGLANRAALILETTRLLKFEGQDVAAAFIDLDGFKEVNDTYDHETGDRLIRAVAAGLRSLARDEVNVFRLGGDEFVALFSGKHVLARAQSFASQLIGFLSAPFDFEGRLATVGASVGIASTVAERVDAPELMRRADIAMYKAKDNGRNRYCVYSDDFDMERAENRSIANELREIIAAGTLEIAYQPVVNAQTRAIVGVEALARWPSTSVRKVPPDKFIRVAESCGIIDALGEAILGKACREASAWKGLMLSANISPVQLRNPEFVTRTLQTISRNGMDCSSVELEITEGTLVEDVSKAKQIFDAFRAAGVQVALDDFGTGYSSIGYLREFHFDRIKIDRSIVSRMLTGGAEQNIVQGTMLMAAGLTAKVTAEGVEDEDQMNLLRLTGCTEMQGYYFSRPLPAAEINRLIASQQAQANSDKIAAA